MGSGNDSGSDSNPCPRGRSSPYIVGATASPQCPPQCYTVKQFYDLLLIDGLKGMRYINRHLTLLPPTLLLVVVLL